MAITDREVIEEFRDQQKLAQTGGKMFGGGAESANRDAAGGPGHESGRPGTNPDGLSRGERFDLEQGGGRGVDELDETNELQEDQQAHQDRGQSIAEDQEETGERS